MRAVCITVILSLVFCFSITPARAGEEAKSDLEVLESGKGKEYDLKLDFTPGRTRTVVITRNLSGSRRNVPHVVEKKTHMTQTVEADNAGGYRVTRTFERLIQKVNYNTVTIVDCDTARKGEPLDEIGIILSGLPGKSLILCFDNSLELTEIKGKEEAYNGMVDALKKKVGDKGTAADFEGARKKLEQSFHLDDFLEDLVKTETIIPGRKFAVGAKWRQPYTISFPDFTDIEASLTTEFMEVKGNVAVLRQTMQVPDNASATYQTLMEMSVALLNGSNTVCFDLEKKELKAFTRELHLEFSGTAPGGQKLVMKRNTKEIFEYGEKPGKKPGETQAPEPAPEDREQPEKKPEKKSSKSGEKQKPSGAKPENPDTEPESTPRKPR
ncbi:MAG: hypothetical protein E3J72_14025 [Planctomycetota bacterium]|nr:MAG: hypothetical protein E3J72_14025 [Planctomycetota bacterium]